MTLIDYVYDAEVIAWIDGDTVALSVNKSFDMGFHVTVVGNYRGHFRLMGVDTPERGHLNAKEAKEAAKVMAPVGSMVSIETMKADKYGRYLAKVTLPDGRIVSNELIKMGLGYPYFGGHKPTEEEQIAVLGEVHIPVEPTGEVAVLNTSGTIEITQQ